MNLLPDELFDLICCNLKHITDIRNLSRVCKKYNLKCEQKIIDMELYYKKKYHNLDFVNRFEEYCVEKFTIEIVLDGYCNLLPSKYYNKNNEIMCSILAFCGNFELLKIAHLTSCPLVHYAASCAAHEGHVEILNWISNFFDINMRIICSNGAGNGHINILDWLINNKYEMGRKELDMCIIKASRRGHMNVLEWLLKHNFIIDTPKCIESTSDNSRIKILQWLFDNKLIVNSSFCEQAKNKGYLDILDFALNKGFIITNDNIELVIIEGHINVLQWLYDNNNFKPNNTCCINTIIHGKIDVLIWMLNHGCHIDETVFDYLIKYNRINMLQWLLDNKYNMNYNIYETAIYHGKYDVVKWIITNNIYIEPITLEIKSHNYKLIKLLLNHDLLIINSTNFIEILSSDIDIETIQLIGEKHFIIKKQYHFVIENSIIKIKNYESGPDLNKQKIIYYGNDGDIDICDFNCDCKCWWYFLIHCENRNQNVKNLAKCKISTCNKHTKYINSIT